VAVSVLDTFNLAGRRAIVTGTSRGLGQAFAMALAEAGADVAAVSRNYERTTEVAADIAKATGRRVVSFVSATKLSPNYAVEIFRLGPRNDLPLDEPSE